MLTWFRHYPGMVRDEKLVAAAISAGQPIERTIWLWCALLENAAQADDAGAFTIDLDAAAWFLRCAPADLQGIMDALEVGGRIQDGRILAWPARQYQSDRSTPRSRKLRQSRRDGDGLAALL